MRHVIFGAMFSVVIFTLGYYTIFLSSFTLGGSPELEVEFDDAAGLLPGDPVRIAGLRIGRVEAIDYRESPTEPPKVVVRVSFKRDIKLYEDARVRNVSASLLGGRLIAIDPGSAGEAVPASSWGLFKGELQPEILQSAESLISDNRESVRRMLLNLAEASNEANALLRELQEGRGTAGQLFKNDSLYKEIEALVKDIRDPRNTFGRLLQDDKLYVEIEGAAAALREILEGVRDGKGAVGYLFRDDGLQEQIRTIAARIDDLVAAAQAGEGLLGALFIDDELKRSVQEIARNLQHISEEIASGRSTAGEILVGDRLTRTVIQPIEDMLADGRALIRNVREGRGVAGLLLNDDESAALLRSILRNFGRSLEDAREAAPIGTLVGVLVGVF